MSAIELTGLEGANPLGFLAAVGALRLGDQLFPGCRLRWARRGRWLPVLEIPGEVGAAELTLRVSEKLHQTADSDAEDDARRKQKAWEVVNRRSKEAEKQLKLRGLRGEARAKAIRDEIEPIRQEAAEARAEWLNALARAVPAPFLALGKTLSVPAEEFATFTRGVRDRLHAGGVDGPGGREDADFGAAFGSEPCVRPNGTIQTTQFQLITGTGHQFFLETIRLLMEEITQEKLSRSLFGPWTYADAKRSFRWNPGEDRRYAYGWSGPSGDEVRTEHGANLLAAMALPLFPAVPTARGLATTGFTRFGQVVGFTWPIWEAGLSPDVVRSLLACAELTRPQPERGLLSRRGVVEVFRSKKIEVGRPPLSKWNLTPSAAV